LIRGLVPGASARGVTGIHVLRRDRLGGLIHEYFQVAWGDTIACLLARI
jgi:hypothetical protein